MNSWVDITNYGESEKYTYIWDTYDHKDAKRYGAGGTINMLKMIPKSISIKPISYYTQYFKLWHW